MKTNCRTSSCFFAQKSEANYRKALAGPSDHTYPYFHHYDSQNKAFQPLARGTVTLDKGLHKERKRMESRSDIFHYGQTEVLANKIKTVQEEDIKIPELHVFEPGPHKSVIQTQTKFKSPSPSKENQHSQTQIPKAPRPPQPAKQVKKYMPTATPRITRVMSSWTKRDQTPVKKQHLHAEIYELEIRKGWELLTISFFNKIFWEGQKLVSMNPGVKKGPVHSQGVMRVEYRRGIRELLRRLKEKGILAVAIHAN